MNRASCTFRRFCHLLTEKTNKIKTVAEVHPYVASVGKRGAYGNTEKEYQYGIREQDVYRGGHYCAAGRAEGRII